MTLSNEEAQQLINLPKRFNTDDEKGNPYVIRFSEIIDDNFLLQSEDGNLMFLLSVHQSEKDHLKITLHFQEHSQYIGLLSVVICSDVLNFMP